MNKLHAVILLSSLGLVACAAHSYEALPRPLLNNVAGVDHTEDTFDGNERVKLFMQTWLPASETVPINAAVVIVHGLKDHSSRYNEFAQELVQNGYSVWAFDLRGHGSSEGDRVYVHSFDDYLADLDIFLTTVKEREPGKPVYLLGHSMGGTIVALYMIRQHADIKGLILSAPALKPGKDIGSFKMKATRLLGTITPTLAIMDLNLDKFSRDPAVVKECREDPLVDQGKGPARTAAQLLNAMDEIQQKMEDITTPLLILHGSADVITNPDGSRELAERAKSTDKNLVVYDGLYHDLLHEPEKAKVTKTIVQWLNTRTQPPKPIVGPMLPGAPVVNVKGER